MVNNSGIIGNSNVQTTQQATESENDIITRKKLQELVNQIAPSTKLESDVEEVFFIV